MDINCYRLRLTLGGRSLISSEKLTPGELMEILTAAKELKTKLRYGVSLREFVGKNMLIFNKLSLGKSRITLELAAKSLGFDTISLSLNGEKIEEFLASSESIQVIDRLDFSAAAVDTEEESDAEKLSEHLKMPVINANDSNGLCEALAVLLTVWEEFGKLKNVKLVIVGDANTNKNLLFAAVKCGMDVCVVCPTEFKPNNALMDYCRQFSDASYSDNLAKGLAGANVIFCGQHDFISNYTINEQGLAVAAENAIVLQNIPLTRGKQVDENLYNGNRMRHLEQGENVSHIERAAIYLVAEKTKEKN